MAKTIKKIKTNNKEKELSEIQEDVIKIAFNSVASFYGNPKKADERILEDACYEMKAAIVQNLEAFFSNEPEWAYNPDIVKKALKGTLKKEIVEKQIKKEKKLRKEIIQEIREKIEGKRRRLIFRRKDGREFDAEKLGLTLGSISKGFNMAIDEILEILKEYEQHRAKQRI